LKPLLIGDTVYVVTEVAQLAPNGRRQGKVVWRRQLVNQRGEVVQEGLFETLVAIDLEKRKAANGNRTQGLAPSLESSATSNYDYDAATT
jgi:hypothetical protein